MNSFCITQEGLLRLKMTNPKVWNEKDYRIWKLPQASPKKETNPTKIHYSRNIKPNKTWAKRCLFHFTEISYSLVEQVTQFCETFVLRKYEETIGKRNKSHNRPRKKHWPPYKAHFGL